MPVRSSRSTSRSRKVAVEFEGVGGLLDRLVRPAEAEEVGRDDPPAGREEDRDHLPVEVGPGRLPVQQQVRVAGGARPEVDVVRPQALEAGEVLDVRGAGGPSPAGRGSGRPACATPRPRVSLRRRAAPCRPGKHPTIPVGWPNGGRVVRSPAVHPVRQGRAPAPPAPPTSMTAVDQLERAHGHRLPAVPGVVGSRHPTRRSRPALSPGRHADRDSMTRRSAGG